MEIITMYGPPGLLKNLIRTRNAWVASSTGGWNFTGISFGKTEDMEACLSQPADSITPILIKVTVAAQGEQFSFAGFGNLALIHQAKKAIRLGRTSLSHEALDDMIPYRITILPF